LKPTPEVVSAFYDFLKELFSRNIDHPFLQYFNDFKENLNRRRVNVEVSDFERLIH